LRHGSGASNLSDDIHFVDRALGEALRGHLQDFRPEVPCAARILCEREIMFIELMTSDRKLKASREGSK